MFSTLSTTEIVNDLYPNIQERKDKVTKMKTTHPDYIPVYATFIGQTDVYRFLLHKGSKLSALMFTFRKKITLPASTGLFLMIEKEDDTGKVSCFMANTHDDIASVHSKYVHKDGFIYLHFAQENVFG